MLRPEPVEPAEFVECAEPALCTDDWLIWLLLLVWRESVRVRRELPSTGESKGFDAVEFVCE